MTQIDELKLLAAVNAAFPQFREVLQRQLDDKIKYMLSAQDDVVMRQSQGSARTLTDLIARLGQAKDTLERRPPPRG